jgi:hypothetical protein
MTPALLILALTCSSASDSLATHRDTVQAADTLAVTQEHPKVRSCRDRNHVSYTKGELMELIKMFYEEKP